MISPRTHTLTASPWGAVDLLQKAIIAEASDGDGGNPHEHPCGLARSAVPAPHVRESLMVSQLAPRSESVGIEALCLPLASVRERSRPPRRITHTRFHRPQSSRQRSRR
jgi:hypothetical protein